MKHLILALFAVLLVTTVRAETVAVEFAYNGQADSYTLYVDEDSYCEIIESEVTRNPGEGMMMNCNPVDIVPGWHSFTMTATLGTEETKHSNEFQWFKDFPVEGEKPTVITITIGINGEAVILQ